MTKGRGTVIPIRLFGDPVLRTPCRDVETFDDLLTTINSRLDFAQRIVERPVPWLVGGVLVGFMLGHPRAR